MKPSYASRNMLKKINLKMEEYKSITTPIKQKVMFCKQYGVEKVDEGLYRILVGCLLHLTTMRSNILYVMSFLSRYMHCAREIHFQTANHVIRYVKVTTNLAL